MACRGTEPADARHRHKPAMRPVLFMVVIVAGAAATPQLPIRADGDTSPPAQRCTPHCDEAQPRSVCGTDGTTYPSRCHLGLAACRGAAVQLQHVGNCIKNTGDSACLRKRAEALQGQPGGSLPQNIYVPECTDDGLYAEVQCHRGSGHCWCVDDYGRAALGTAVQNARPDCSVRSSRASTDVAKRPSTRRWRNGRRRRGCGSRAKTVFREDIMQMIKREFERKQRRRNRNNRRRSNAKDLATRAAEWKFRRLDRNRDGQVSRKEMRRLRKKARRHLKPRACSRRFQIYCDTDSNRKLSKQEWLVCVGINRDDNTRLDHLSSPSNKIFDMLDGNADEKSTDEQENGCEADRSRALDNQRMAEQEGKLTNSFFIPSCTPDHKYSRIQCHNTTGYCWCADPDTGAAYPQTPVKDSVPDCSAARPSTKKRSRGSRGRPKVPKACRSGARRQNFLHLLMDHLTSRLVKALQQRKYILPPDTDGQKTFEEKVAEWKFTATDVNENNVLDRREWRTLRQEFSGVPKLKRCGRRLPRHCDANDDREIDLDEWLFCVGAVKEEPRPTKGPNPFEVYLDSSDSDQ